MTALDLFKQRLSLLRPFLSTGSIDEKMIELLKPILDEIITFIALPIFDEHNFSEIQRVTINRNVLNGENKSIETISFLKYPPPEYVSYGRANVNGQSVLYATFNLMTAIKEMKPNIGDLITISTWTILETATLSVAPIFKITSKDGIVHNELSLFYLNEFEKLKKTLSKDVADQSDELMAFMAECFAKKVEYRNKYDYYLSAYFADRIFAGLNVDALVYPSFPEDFSFSNIAIKPQSFDDKYILNYVEECIVMEIPNINGHIYNLKSRASTKNFSKNKIFW